MEAAGRPAGRGHAGVRAARPGRYLVSKPLVTIN